MPRDFVQRHLEQIHQGIGNPQFEDKRNLTAVVQAQTAPKQVEKRWNTWKEVLWKHVPPELPSWIPSWTTGSAGSAHLSGPIGGAAKRILAKT